MRFVEERRGREIVRLRPASYSTYVGSGFLYMVAIIYRNPRKALSWHLSNTMDAE